jgi:hypothetical protein
MYLHPSLIVAFILATTLHAWPKIQGKELPDIRGAMNEYTNKEQERNSLRPL